MQRKIPCVLMRGGTSRGPYFLASDLPSDIAQRDAVLLALMGSPHPLQVDGIGGANPLTSKVAIVSRSSRDDADVDYLFAQVMVNEAKVDTNPNCGNMLAGVAPFALEKGLVSDEEKETLVRIYNVNSKSIVHSRVQTPNRQVTYEGTAKIDGVAGTGAPVWLSFINIKPSLTGKMFPTGNLIDVFDGIEVTCVDLAVPLVLISASQLDKRGSESPEDINADFSLRERIEAIRRQAGVAMGLDTSQIENPHSPPTVERRRRQLESLNEIAQKVVPKVALVAKPYRRGSICSRYMTPFTCHRAYAVTGAITLAGACSIPGTVAASLIQQEGKEHGQISIEHPSGSISVSTETGANNTLTQATVLRTVRPLFEGNVLIPGVV